MNLGRGEVNEIPNLDKEVMRQGLFRHEKVQKHKNSLIIM